MRDTLDPNASFGGYKASDVKKEFYQLLTTTNDPAVVSNLHTLLVLTLCSAT